MFPRLGRALTRRRGTPQWNAVIRGSGVIALLALYPTIRWPEIAGLVGFLGITIALNGPLSPLFPAMFEPVLVLAGRFYPPLVIGVVATAGTLYIEYINYYLYRYAVFHPRLERAREHFWVRKSAQLFQWSPFWAIVLLAFTPLPYWVARILAPLIRYPIGRYLLATFIGRFPRLWAYAAVGTLLPFSTRTVVLGALAVTAVLLPLLLLLRRRGAAVEAHM